MPPAPSPVKSTPRLFAAANRWALGGGLFAAGGIAGVALWAWWRGDWRWTAYADHSPPGAPGSARLFLLLCAAALGAGLIWRQRRTEITRLSLNAENERKALVQRLALVMHHANDIILMMDETGRILEANERALQTYGYTLDELRHLPPGGLRGPDDRHKVTEQLELFSHQGVVFETVHHRKDGSAFPVEISGSSFEMENRRFKLGVYRDISQRKAHEQQIHRVNRIYSALSHVNLTIVSSRTREDLCASICRVLVEYGQFKMAWIGWHDPATAAVTPLATFGDDGTYLKSLQIYADDRPEGRSPTGTAIREGCTFVCNDPGHDPRTLPWRDDAERHGIGALIALPVRQTGMIVGALTVYAAEKDFFGDKEISLLEEAANDISFALENFAHEALRQQAERRIREQAELLDKATEAIIVGDLANHITFWSLGAERLFGWTAAEMVGEPLHEALELGGVTSGANVRTAITELADWHGEIRGHRRNGDPLVISTSITLLRDEAGQPTGRLLISSDITEKKKLEEQYLRAQRLESIGMLAAGIAHDLNNVLAPVGMAATLLRRSVSAPGDVRLLDTLERSADRGAGLVRQILGFARGAGDEPRLIQVKHLLRDLTEVITQTFPRSITLEENLPDDLWLVFANPSQIHQVLLNLCVNARDAMPQGGTLHLGAENLVLDEGTALAIPGARPGAWLVLHVEDTGTGIPPDVVAHIWEPFFTTKSADKGTGLGLATVRGIVETHRGFITLHTEPGRGTAFHIYLPAAGTGAKTDDIPAGALPARAHGELILVADDEESIRETVGAMLTSQGYRVITATDGIEAATLFETRASEISLIITDRDMPGFDGDALAVIIHAVRPSLPILMMSGLANSGRNPNAPPPAPFTTFMQKPFTATTMLQHVHHLLHGSASPL